MPSPESRQPNLTGNSPETGRPGPEAGGDIQSRAEQARQSLGELLAEFQALSPENQRKFEALEGDIRGKIAELEAQGFTEEADKAAAEILIGETQELISRYQTESGLIVLQEKYKGGKGVEFLDTEKLKTEHGETIAKLLRLYSSAGGKLEIGADEKAIADKLFADLGITEAEFKEMLKLSEALMVEKERVQVQPTQVFDVEHKVGAWLGEKFGKKGKFFGKAGLGMGESIAVGIAASSAASLAFSALPALAATAAAVGGWRVARRLLPKWRASIKTEKSLREAMSEDPAAGETSTETKASQESYKRRVIDIIQANIIEKNQQARGERPKEGLAELQSRYIGGKITKEEFSQGITELRAASAGRAAEAGLDAAETERRKQESAALQTILMTSSMVEMEKGILGRAIKEKGPSVPREIVGVVGSTLVARALYRVPVVAQLMSAYGGMKMGKSYFQEMHSDDRRFVNEDGTLTEKGKTWRAVNVVVGAGAMTAFSVLSLGRGEGVKELIAEWKDEGIGGYGYIKESLGLGDKASEAALSPTGGEGASEQSGKPDGFPPGVGPNPVGTPGSGQGALEHGESVPPADAALAPHSWEDTILTPEGSNSHDSVWASTRVLVKAHAAELGWKGDPADLDKWAETQTANLVKQLGIEQGGQVKDLVHNGDRVILSLGADNKPHLSFEASSGIEAGHLPEVKPQPVAPEAAPAAEAQPQPPAATAAPIEAPEQTEFVNLMDKPPADMDKDEKFHDLAEELRRHAPLHLPGHGPRSEELALHLRGWAEAQGLSAEQADQFVDQLAGDDDKLTRDDFIKQGLYDKKSHEVPLDKLEASLNEFRGQPRSPLAVSPATVPAAEAPKAAETPQVETPAAPVAEKPLPPPVEVTGPETKLTAAMTAFQNMDEEARKGLGLAVFGSPNAEKLFTYASDFGRANNLSETDARLYAAWLGGEDGVLKRDDLKPLFSAAAEGKSHLDMAALAKTVETFQTASHLHDVPKGGGWQPRLVYLQDEQAHLVNFRETGKGFVYDMNADGKADIGPDGKVVYMDKDQVTALLSPSGPEAPAPTEAQAAKAVPVEAVAEQPPAPLTTEVAVQEAPAPAPETPVSAALAEQKSHELYLALRSGQIKKESVFLDEMERIKGHELTQAEKELSHHFFRSVRGTLFHPPLDPRGPELEQGTKSFMLEFMASQPPAETAALVPEAVAEQPPAPVETAAPVEAAPEQLATVFNLEGEKFEIKPAEAEQMQAYIQRAASLLSPDRPEILSDMAREFKVDPATVAKYLELVLTTDFEKLDDLDSSQLRAYEEVRSIIEDSLRERNDPTFALKLQQMDKLGNYIAYLLKVKEAGE